VQARDDNIGSITEGLRQKLRKTPRYFTPQTSSKMEKIIVNVFHAKIMAQQSFEKYSLSKNISI